MKVSKDLKKLTVNLPKENWQSFPRSVYLPLTANKPQNYSISSNPTYEISGLTKVHKSQVSSPTYFFHSDAKKEMLGTFKNLLRLASFPLKYIPLLSGLFITLSKRESRTNLCGIFQEMAKISPEISDLVGFFFHRKFT